LRVGLEGDVIDIAARRADPGEILVRELCTGIFGIEEHDIEVANPKKRVPSWIDRLDLEAEPVLIEFDCPVQVLDPERNLRNPSDSQNRPPDELFVKKISESADFERWSLLLPGRIACSRGSGWSTECNLKGNRRFAVQPEPRRSGFRRLPAL